VGTGVVSQDDVVPAGGNHLDADQI